MREPLDTKRAPVESSRCYFCYDAPCVEACPTRIDIPNFIRKIQTGNIKGSAVTILEQNIFGGACARVCPTEVLCERACVRNLAEEKPVTIGLLQRYATDWLFHHRIQPFTRAPRTGRRVAVVGGVPAGLACAHRLAMLGHDVAVFEARPKLGGLNEYGIAAYKVPQDFAQREVDFILSIGGIEPHTGVMLGRDVTLAQLRQDFDAVFLGLGLAGVNALQAEGETILGGPRRGGLYCRAASGEGEIASAGGPSRAGDRRRQYGDRHRGADETARRRGCHHSLPPWTRPDGGHPS